MFIDLSFLTSDTVISAAMAFSAGMVSVTAYFRLSGQRSHKRDYHADEAIVEAVVAEYTRRLGDYDKVLAEMRMKMDLLEIRSSALPKPDVTPVSSETSHISRPSQPVANRTPHVTSGVTVTQHAQVTTGTEGQNGTSDYILKIIAEKPRTSREVQLAIGRTREHTARLLKKLHDSNLVLRNNADKPFTYVLTDLGWARLREKAEAAPGVRLT